jgi:hypothetical protein
MGGVTKSIEHDGRTSALDIAPKEATLWRSFRVETVIEIEEKIAARYFNDEISSRSSNLFRRAISPEQAIAPPKGP